MDTFKEYFLLSVISKIIERMIFGQTSEMRPVSDYK